MQQIKHKPYTKSYLPILLAFILTNEILDNYILNIFSSLEKQSKFLEFTFYLFFLLVQIIASPIQAGYSDFYCRKKSLVVSLSFSAITLIPAFFFFHNIFPSVLVLALMTVIKGGFGNTLPLSWAAIADTQTKNIRFSFGLSTTAMALGYLALILLNNLFKLKDLTIVLFFVFITLALLCVKQFLDIRADKRKDSDAYEIPSLKNDVKELINNFLKRYRFRKGLKAFLLWEVSFYSIHILDVDLKILKFKGLTLAMIFGYIVGVICLRFAKKEDYEIIKIGYKISIISILPIFVLFPFFRDVKLIMMPCYFVYALGIAFLVPSLFAIMAKEMESHEQGKIYGLFDSTDTVAFLLSSIVSMLYNYLKLNPIYIVSFSFFIFIISWFPYAKFRNASSE